MGGKNEKIKRLQGKIEELKEENKNQQEKIEKQNEIIERHDSNIDSIRETAKEYEKKRPFIIANNIIQLILFAVEMVLLLMARTGPSFIYKYSEAVKNNNVQSLIFIDSIKIINSTEFCDVSYEVIKLGEWSGNKEGCYKNGTYYFGKCQGDNFIPKTDKKDIYNYRGKKICKSKINQISYKNIFKQIHPSKCPEKEIDCGEIDTLHQHYCVKSINECPINYFKFSKEIPPELENKNFAFFDFGESKTLFISNEMGEKGKIIAQFQISDSTPCEEPQLFTSSNKEKYIFENYVKINSCNDSRYEKEIIDSYSKELIHKENFINPMFYPYNETISNLYGVLYYGYNVSKDRSKQIMDSESFDYYASTIEKSIKSSDYLIWILGLISGLDICLSLGFLYNLFVKLFAKANFFWTFASLFGSLIGIGFFIANIYYLTRILFLIEGYDRITGQLLNREIEIIYSVRKLYIYALIETGIITGTVVIIIILFALLGLFVFLISIACCCCLSSSDIKEGICLGSQVTFLSPFLPFAYLYDLFREIKEGEEAINSLKDLEKNDLIDSECVSDLNSPLHPEYE